MANVKDKQGVGIPSCWESAAHCITFSALRALLQLEKKPFKWQAELVMESLLPKATHASEVVPPWLRTHVVQGFIGRASHYRKWLSGLSCELPSPMWFLAPVTPFCPHAATNGPTCMLCDLLTKATMCFLRPLVRIPSQRILLTSATFVHKSLLIVGHCGANKPTSYPRRTEDASF